jgi:16S rRNA (cytosine967-C5)-methyltransferase
VAVEAGEEASAQALAVALDRFVGPDDRERSLATELFYGTLRKKARLDHVLGKLAAHGLAHLPTAAAWALRMGVYQLVALDRVPAHAAVTNTVIQVKAHAGPKLGGFANAVLRRLTREPELALGPEGSDAAALATRHSHPLWVVEGWVRDEGTERAAALAQAYDGQAPVCVRVTPGAQAFVEGWLAAHPHIIAAPGGLPRALHLRGGVDPLLAEPFRRGAFMPADEASQLVGEIAIEHAGPRMLELCAGTGTKTVQLATTLGPRTELTAVDIDRAKLGRNRALAAQFGVEHRVTWRQADARDPRAFAPQSFDTVLLDAPCSGLGAMRRRPEMKWRRTPADVAQLAQLQLALLHQAQRWVAPGGVLVYAVCTFTREEGPEVVHTALKDPDWSIRATAHADPDGFVRTSPLEHSRDGFFIAVLQRRP